MNGVKALRAPATPRFDAPTATPAVLCVDPSELDVLLLGELAALNPSGPRVLHVSDAESAMRLLHNEEVRVVLLSPCVQDTDWTALVGRLRRHVPVWVWGGRRAADHAQALAAGAARCLEKPQSLDGYAALLGDLESEIASSPSR